MVIILFSIDNKDGKSYLVKKTFLLANMSMDIAFEMSFLTLSNIQIIFNDQELG